ncbi:hypothetical protein BACCIP111895_03786 [Neobacillus rhizosphaerae]|uniref:Anti-sigma-W factor RsiW n=1 Tax=Neobacillus rhizosphaerae TaxID=2880965 RepID=A0ABN8KVG6_9BACI|nr:DUF5643 domain-containing protein [Neobacillus rhizosphaerae]CAH2716599.1 hypothetical protein BACCIP111895_03786 [Neobacillus rhizosphaerae]
MNCRESQEQLIDYLEGNLDEISRIELELHLQGCVGCQQEMRELQQLVAALESDSERIQVPDDFMKNVRTKVAKSQESSRKSYKQRAMIGLVAMLFLTVFVGTAVATNSFASVLDWWKDLSAKQDEQTQDYVQHGLGERLNLAAESNGVKVTITSVVADDIQTLIYYEIDDQNKGNKYMINYSDGLKIANQDQDWKREDHPAYLPVTNHLSLYSKTDHVYKGRLGVAPMTTDVGSIQLELSKLEKVTQTPGDPDTAQSVSGGKKEFVAGDWRFDIPVKKHPAIVHKIHVETKIDGNPIIFDKLTIAPTITVLSYRYRNENPDKSMEYIKISSLESKGKLVYDQFGLGGYGGSSRYEKGWNSAEATFESLYFEKPTDVKIHIDSATFSVSKHAKFAIDSSKGLPQSFEYLGNKLTIEQMEIGTPTKIVMTEELNPNRAYEMLDYHFYDKDGHGGSGASINGYYIDKKGDKYKIGDYLLRQNELDHPRMFSTEHHIEFSGGNNVPVGVEIEGYKVTSFYDKVVGISLD